jgi:L-fuconolactonase
MIRIDTHQHFWNLDEVSYPWLGPKFGALNRTFDTQHLEPLLRECNIQQTVIVQAANSYEDTASMLKIADTYDWVGGVTGWVNLLDPAETDYRLSMYTRHPKFRGVRHLIHDEPDENWVLRDNVIESIKLIAARGVIFEMPDAYPRNLKQVPQIISKVPDVKLVIDHLAKPPIRSGQLNEWSAQLKDAASNPLVYSKVSGLDTAADPTNWSAKDLEPAVDFALSCFGADRLMFGSDWPVSELGGGYPKLIRETEKVLGRYSVAEQEAIWSKTAIRLYALPDRTQTSTARSKEA